MNPEKQRIAIAQACGWSDIQHGPYDGQPFGRHKDRELLLIPDYLNDLNAMREVEKEIEELGLMQSYLAALAKVKGYSVHQPEQWNEIWACLWGAVNATAAQRAEAFLRTIGKWEDAK